MFALVDANSFYCSAEQVFRPDWRGRPMVVLSNNDGCVVAANRQALAAGVEKFKPYFQVRQRCEQAGVVVCSSNYELYGDLSSRMMEVVGRFAPEQHIYSIDESFLSFRGWQLESQDYLEHAMALRRAVWRECRLPVSVGLGRTLTLAKAANQAAKKLPHLFEKNSEGRLMQGVCLLDEHNIAQVLPQLASGQIWGVGRKLAARLAGVGVETAWQLVHLPLVQAKKVGGIELERIVRELSGERCKGFDATRADKQQIFSTRSMGERITSEQALREALCTHAGIAASKAREQGSLCRQLYLFAASSPHDRRSVHYKYQHRFATPVNDVCVLNQVISSVMPRLYERGVRYYKVGVGLVDLVDVRYDQLDLFAPPPPNPALMQMLDGVNHKYGRDTLFTAAQGVSPKWGMRREFLTPQYTTRWRDIPTIACK
ncbi:Protein UmuC [Vibrio stylophorae]|uniref:Protein UmuC n=1 Tax=Vibrio stylophorae TaxID=659351 RepID=A0ABN8DRZ8_9VIBR|nr:Y-family DNA polymerase [Vibrio stylophorae]CAH0533103.1 Protein UmuC [Vibrio stylophorae]